MFSRRQILGSGLSAAAYGLLARPARTIAQVFGVPPMPRDLSDPFLDLPLELPSTLVDGIPFAPWFTGDDFANTDIPFHTSFAGELPSVEEDVEVAVVGAGLSGLCCAYLLRRHEPVLFDLRPRFGGNALGERWRDMPYSLGSAYVITPDPGTFLWRLYHRLGLHRVRRESFPPDPVELGGAIRTDFWSGGGMSPDEQIAFQRYADVVRFMADEGYPEIPLPDDAEGAAYVRELDTRNFREDLTARMGMDLSPLLNAGVQSYFYSSFGVGMEETSAAAGWNFVAAEEYGRWIFPGGNAYLAWALWQRLARRSHAGRPLLRPGCRVVDVRTVGERVQVTWVDAADQVHSLRAKYVVMANSKHICKYMLPQLEEQDPRKLQAMHQIETMAYVVANVLLDAPIQRDFYDCFLIGDESFPVTPDSFEADSRVVDMLRGDFARTSGTRSVLSLYWPLPWHRARFSLISGDPWRHYADSLVPRLRQMLSLVQMPESAVRQVRLTRWGHAMPVARPGIIAEGTAAELRRPLLKRIFFANQDNWALPAVENSLLDAETVAVEIDQRLRP